MLIDLYNIENYPAKQDGKIIMVGPNIFPEIHLIMRRGKIHVINDYLSRIKYHKYVKNPENFVVEIKKFGTYYKKQWYAINSYNIREQHYIIRDIIKDSIILDTILEETKKCILKSPPKLTFNKIVDQKDPGWILYCWAHKYGKLPEEYEKLFFEIGGYNVDKYKQICLEIENNK
jgi:hypothetical protein